MLNISGHTQTRTQKHTHTHTHTYNNTHTQTHTHSQTHIYTCTNAHRAQQILCWRVIKMMCGLPWSALFQTEYMSPTPCIRITPHGCHGDGDYVVFCVVKSPTTAHHSVTVCPNNNLDLFKLLVWINRWYLKHLKSLVVNSDHFV